MSANKTRTAIEEEVKTILEEAERIDAAEDQAYGEDRGDELPEELRSSRSRLARLRQAKERLEREEQEREGAYQQKQREREAKEARLGRRLRGRKPGPRKPERSPQANITDPDSRILKSAHWFVQGYNAQALVSEDQIVLAADLTNETNDVGALHPMLNQATANLEAAGSSAKVGVLVADAGYFSDENVIEQSEGGPELLIATNKGWRHRKVAERNPPRGRIPKNTTAKQRMERKLETKRGQRLYKKRSQTVEPVFGQHVVRGFGGFIRRGLESCRCEWRLENTAHNILKPWRSSRSIKKGLLTYGTSRSRKSASLLQRAFRCLVRHSTFGSFWDRLLGLTPFHSVSWSSIIHRRIVCDVSGKPGSELPCGPSNREG